MMLGSTWRAEPGRADQLSPGRREALSDGFQRVGRQLLESAVRADVDVGWADHTWPRRRYPQQCYARTVKYVLDHPEIDGLRLVHGVVSHAPHFVPLDHAWVELPGEVVFDGVVQAFFTRESYYAVMAAVPMDTLHGPRPGGSSPPTAIPAPGTRAGCPPTPSWTPTRPP